MSISPRSRSRWSVSPLAFASLIALAGPVAAQDEPPSPEELEARAVAAENAPLFQTHEPLVMTLRTRIDWILDERPDEEEAEGTLTYVAEDGSEVTVELDVRARGLFRRNKRNCRFPPLRLDFPRGDMDGTIFETQNRMDLVTPCHDEREDYQQYIYHEYLAYRILNLFGPLSRRVRLIRVTYEDTDGEYETRTKMGFLVEEEDQMAYRNRVTLLEVPQLHPATMDAEQEMFVSLFNYMIGNTDYSPAFFHNVRLVSTPQNEYKVIPYDFDFSGLVNARYATVPELLQDRIRRVTDRLYRGFCRPGLTREHWAPIFNEKKDAIWALYNDFELLEEDEREDALEYLDEFYETINDDRRFEREILRECREIPG